MNNKFWQGKKVFLTGSTGFKGAWLSLWLSSLGAEVIGYALAPPTEPNLFNEVKLNGKIEQIIGNVGDFTQTNNSMMAANPDIVIHMAAQALVRESYQVPVLTYQTNVMGTVNVLESMRNCKNVRAAVVVTTDKCYENKEWCWGYRENEMLGGYDPYSSSKACAELVTAAYRQSFLRDTGISVATARAGNVIGGGDWAQDRLIPDCLKAIAANKTVIIRSPQAIRPWQHVLEPLAGYLTLAEKLYEAGAPWAESWNFGPPDSSCVTVEAIVKILCVTLGGNYELCNVGDLHEANFLKLDSAKARQYLQWQNKLTVATALSWIMDWQQAYWGNRDMSEFTLQQIVNYQNINYKLWSERIEKE